MIKAMILNCASHICMCTMHVPILGESDIGK